LVKLTKGVIWILAKVYLLTKNLLRNRLKSE
jgi:hypothetical protein